MINEKSLSYKVKSIYRHFFPRKEKSCPICDAELLKFKRLDDFYWKKWDENNCIHSPFQLETLNWLEYECPMCHSADRERLYALYFKKFRESFHTNFKLLDFAPSKPLSNFLKRIPGINYRSADLYMDEVDDKVDIQNMSLYEDEKFDFIVCSHVLEHVDNDAKAFNEIYRILKKGGRAILMVPISLALEATIENTEFTSIEDKWKYFGQDDHVRFYSKNDFKMRIENAGFKLSEYDVDAFGLESFFKFGIHPRSILYIAKK